LHNHAPYLYTRNVKTTYLTALGASPTLEAELVDLQRSILASTGRVSALALPPVLPLSFASRMPESETLETFRSEGLPALSFGSCSAGEGTIRLGVLPSGYAAEARERLPENDLSAGLFVLPSGFYLAAAETKAVFSAASVRPPEARIRVARLLVLRIEAAEGESWWKSVNVETVFEGWMKA